MWSSEGPCYVIAEAGSNHDGDFHQAVELIQIAADALCNAVKFQLYPPFKREWGEPLQAIAHEAGLDWFATPVDVEGVRYLDELRVPAIKIASPEIVNEALVRAAGETQRPVILSTGMASMGDIEGALAWLPRESIYESLRKQTSGWNVALLQCTTSYPSPVQQANLRAMDTMRDEFGVPVGLSDHTLGINVPIAAAALGAQIIEKHFTLDRSLKGPDHSYALEPEELKAMVSGIRQAEQALGDGRKGAQQGELIEARGRTIQWQT